MNERGRFVARSALVAMALTCVSAGPTYAGAPVAATAQALVPAQPHAAAGPGSAAMAAYAEECGSCHVAYPARLLAAGQWFAVLSALDEHYGVDATVDAATLALVARHLGTTAGVPHAGASATGSTPTLPRITQQRWFVREHREAQLAPTRQLSQCDGCHSTAARGDFDERHLVAGARAPEGRRHANARGPTERRDVRAAPLHGSRAEHEADEKHDEHEKHE